MGCVVLTACASTNHGHHAHHGHHGHDGHGMTHGFADAEAWTKVFDNPERDAWQRPDEVVRQVLGGRNDLRVADVGAGTGYFTLRFAKALTHGKAIAADLEPTMLAKVMARAQEMGLDNVGTAQASATEAGLDGQVDVVFLCNTYHHIADRSAYFARLVPHLAAGGKVVIVDFVPSSKRGPPPEHKMSAEQVDTEMAAAGYALAESWDELPDQYLRVYQPRP